MIYDLIVIGAGPAGLMASVTAAARNKQVLLIEKNKHIGRKLRITGKGRCNLTNDADYGNFIENINSNKKFMLGPLKQFSNTDLINFFENNGLKLKKERGGRLFPQSNNAQDVVDFFKHMINKYNVNLKNEEEVVSVEKNSEVFEVYTKASKYISNSLLISSGGITYPLTGSTGDGYKFALKFGHSIVKPRQGLCGINTFKSQYEHNLNINLKNVSLKLYKKSKLIYKDFGEMMINDYGITGPLVLTASSLISEDISKYSISIDLKPYISEEELDKRIIKIFNNNKNKKIKNVLNEILPKNLVAAILEKSSVDFEKFINIISKDERINIVRTIKNYKQNIISLRPMNEAVITIGGVNVKEINSKNMMSKLIDKLYFAGEVLDIDAFTGGFNLQVAFTSGYIVGNSI